MNFMASPKKIAPHLSPLMNNTKWNELRVAMHRLGQPYPKWRTKCVENGYVSDWDADWLEHLPLCGYEIIEWLEIKVASDDQAAAVLNVLRSVHLPGEKIAGGYRVYGYLSPGAAVDYIK